MRSQVIVIYLLIIAAVCSGAADSAHADDWPMWRYDSNRSASSNEKLPANLKLLWSRKFSPRTQAWVDPLNQDLMTYDRVFEPIVAGGRMFVGFNDQDKLVAIDIKTGKKLWTAFADAPIRFAPVAYAGNVYCTSDDGYLYCWSQKDGSLQWRFRRPSGGQKALGNQRFTSAWPARGGPVVRDGRVYFAASIWPFMGTFIYSMDAATGDVEWVNDSSGSQYIKQPHSAPSFAGVAPQGSLVATDEHLIVPGGRSVPAVFDRKTGKLLHFEINAGGKGTGGSSVSATEKQFFVHTRLKGTRAFDTASGKKTAFMTNEPVLSSKVCYSANVVKKRNVIQALRLNLPDKPGQKKSDNPRLVWEVEADGTGDLIRAGNDLFAGGESTISRVSLEAGQPTVTETIATNCKPERLLAASGMLFAVGLDGTIAAYAANAPRPETRVQDQSTSHRHFRTPAGRKLATKLAAAGDNQGFALWFAARQDDLGVIEFLTDDFTQLAVIDDDLLLVRDLRKYFDHKELYGKVTGHCSLPWKFQAPSYVANMVFVGSELSDSLPGNPEIVAELFRSVRPYGGVMQLLADPDKLAPIADSIRKMALPQAEVSTTDVAVVIKRVGRIAGSDDWTHQYGNIANTVKSDDASVKLPLGVLWFGGGASNVDTLPRHGHGPPEQVIGGRLFIEGMNSLSARDVYTGRALWKREFEDLGTFDVYYDDTHKDTPLNPAYNQVHIPGANARGTNLVATEDLVYIVEGATCHAIDPATGKDRFTIELPQADPKKPVNWGYLGVYEDVLIGGVGFANYRKKHNLLFPKELVKTGNAKGFGSKSHDRAASRALVGFDRHTGKQLWRVDAKHSFWHNGVCAGGGKLFCLDRIPLQIEKALKRRGKSAPETYRILAFDAKTGQQSWKYDKQIFGTWLSYDAESNSVLQAGAKLRDRSSAEVGKGMAMHDASDGSVIWSKPKLVYAGPCMLHNGWVITNSNPYTECAGMFRIKDGKQKMVTNPITGEKQPWKMNRTYGCNNIIACENFLTFRSGAAGFYDLETQSGTGNLGGFKSGCTSNLVVANGVLNAPDYTRTCSCSYQNQTSLALVHMPDIDMWSVNNTITNRKKSDIRHIGINFGAPGDRRDANETLWIEYPKTSGESAPIEIKFKGKPKYVQQHASTMKNTALPWVNASGVRGMTELKLSMRVEEPIDIAKKGIPITSAADDAEEGPDGDVNLSSSDLEFVTDTDQQVIGLRFNKLPIARNTKIRSARIQFTSDEPTKVVTKLSIRAEDAGNAKPFAKTKNNISRRRQTDALVTWAPPEWKQSGKAGNAQLTTNIAPLVQAVVNRNDWKPGNSIAFIVSGEGKRVAKSSGGRKRPGARLLIDAEKIAELPRKPLESKRFEVRVMFAALRETGAAEFDVTAQGKMVGTGLKIGADSNTTEIRFVTDIGDSLSLKLDCRKGSPVLTGLAIAPATN